MSIFLDNTATDFELRYECIQRPLAYPDVPLTMVASGLVMLERALSRIMAER